jgi:hypothetical protein
MRRRAREEEDSPPYATPVTWLFGTTYTMSIGISPILLPQVCAREDTMTLIEHIVSCRSEKEGPCSFTTTHKSDLPHLSSEVHVKTGRTTDDVRSSTGSVKSEQDLHVGQNGLVAAVRRYTIEMSGIDIDGQSNRSWS